MSSILIENATIVSVDDAGHVYRPGYIFIEGERIAALGERPGAGWAARAGRTRPSTAA